MNNYHKKNPNEEQYFMLKTAWELKYGDLTPELLFENPDNIIKIWDNLDLEVSGLTNTNHRTLTACILSDTPEIPIDWIDQESLINYHAYKMTTTSFGKNIELKVHLKFGKFVNPELTSGYQTEFWQIKRQDDDSF